MPKIPIPTPIEYLVRRKFPLIGLMEARDVVVGGQATTREEAENYIARVEAYESELAALPAEELQKLEAAEREAEKKQWQLKAEREEQQRFFNQPSANADCAYWGKLPYWTIEEAIALTYGKNPKIVNWTAIQQVSRSSPFVAAYGRLRELARRAVAMKQLSEATLPGVFLAWAKRMDVGYPAELEREVVARGGRIGDWKTAYDELLAQAGKMLTERDQRIDALTAERESVKGELLELQRAADEASSKAKTPKTKEFESILKLVAGLAYAAYRYNPSASRSDVANQIAGDLATIGLSLDEDTIRKWLRKAGDLMPRGPQKD